MKVSELAKDVGNLRMEMDDKFGGVDKQFERVDKEFEVLRQLIKSSQKARQPDAILMS